MFTLMKKVRQVLAGDRRGVTALEYGLIAAVIGGVVISAATKFGTSLTNSYSTIGGKLVAKANSIP